MNITVIKNIALAGAATIGTSILGLFGGWDSSLQALIIVMGIDYITGLLCALIFKKSPKTQSGCASSNIGFKGLAKKISILLFVLLGVQLDKLAGSDGYCRVGIVLFFIGNEGLSVIENLGLMGLPMPAFITNALEALKAKANDSSNGQTNSNQAGVLENQDAENNLADVSFDDINMFDSIDSQDTK